jgi:hypothetical protein
MKKVIALSAVALLTLTGCAMGTPTVTETVYVTPDSNSSSSSSSVETEFKMYMEAVGTPTWMLNDRDMLDILINQAKDTCGYIKDGQTKDDIVSALTIAAYSTGADDVVVDAMVAATVASTYTYCSQYQGFFN